MINRSRFLGVAFPVMDEASFVRHLERRREEHPGAGHHVWAWRIDAGHARSSDDGEPHGTAGAPLLDLLERQDLTQVGIIVTRYFGGRLLGRPGLLRAYRDTARDALAASPKGRLGEIREVTVRVPWDVYAAVRHEAKRAQALSRESADAEGPLLRLALESRSMPPLLASLGDLTSGRMTVLADLTQETLIPD